MVRPAWLLTLASLRSDESSSERSSHVRSRAVPAVNFSARTTSSNSIVQVNSWSERVAPQKTSTSSTVTHLVGLGARARHRRGQ